MDNIKPTLPEFYRVSNALKDNVDLGDAVIYGMTEAIRECEGSDVERALLYLEMKDLMPFIIQWRQQYIIQALEYLDLGIHTTPISVVPTIMEEPE